jgi:DNA repair exonuclease SbcCD ATPase subunit
LADRRLALPRRPTGVAGIRPPFGLSAASAEARRSIDAIVSATRTPPVGAMPLTPDQSTELEASLRSLATRLEERERAAGELEGTLADRQRDLAEMEALLVARGKVLEAARRTVAVVPRPGVAVSAEEKAALEALKAELDRQEVSLKEQKAALAERERFVNETEAKLFDKMMQQQEQETEIEQKLEEIGSREKRLRNREAVADPQATAAAQAAAPAKKFDEFNE